MTTEPTLNDRYVAALERSADIAWLQYVAGLAPTAVTPTMSAQVRDIRKRIIDGYGSAEPTHTVGSWDATMKHRALAVIVGMIASGRTPHVAHGDVVLTYEDLRRIVDFDNVEIYDMPDRMQYVIRAGRP